MFAHTYTPSGIIIILWTFIYPKGYNIVMKAETLKEIVKRRRKTLKLTQQDLAFKAGVGLRFIRELEQGKLTLQMDKVNQVLMLFGLELGTIPIDRERLLNEEG